MKYRKLQKTIALLLAVMMVVPLLGLSAFSEETLSVSIYKEDFTELLKSLKDGATVTKDHGFSNQIPSKSTVYRENGNTAVRIDLSAAGDPNETVWFNPSSYAEVAAGTAGAIKTDRASYGLITGKDDNLDKNFQLKNPGIRREDYRSVVLSVDYFLSEDAKGTVQSQLLKYKTNNADKTWLALYTITSETGKINVANGTATANSTLKKGAWNTVALVLNLYTGKYEIYLNGGLAIAEGDLGFQNIEILENSWIVGKIPRTRNNSNIASQLLAGYFMVDNAEIYSVGSNTLPELPTTNADGHKLIGVAIKKDGKVVGTSAYTDILLPPGYTAEPRYFDIREYQSMISEAAKPEMRVEADRVGIRFMNKFDKSLLDDLVAMEKDGIITELEIGTLIVPKSFITKAGGLDTEKLDALGYPRAYLDVPATYGEWYNGIPAEKDYYTVAGSVLNFRSSHYHEEFTGVGYVRLSFPNGEIVTICGDYESDSFVTPATMAANALNKDRVYTAKQIELLKRIKTTAVDDVGDAVSDVYYVDDALYFTTEGKVYNRLTYTGNYGWRLVSQDIGNLGFANLGASQALSVYMNEAPVLATEKLAITVDGTKKLITVKSPDGLVAELAIGNTFGLYFKSPEKKEVSHITRITSEKDEIVLYGKLEANEGVYGGGEKFDTVNKRGTSFPLYTGDQWNNSSGTYMAIPLFSTTRGAGIFVNRYESMTVDFGKANSNEWKINIKNELMDTYFYASGDMKDALTGYTILSGSSDLPEEWTYGVLICRYGPDFKTFEKDSLDSNGNPVLNKDNAPSGRSVKTIVNALIAAGMKPSGVIMEGWGWSNISLDNGTAKDNADTLKRTTEWLHENGIKAMVYMRVASSLHTNMAGYKEEYLVRATITSKYGTPIVTYDIPDVSGDGSNPDASGSSSHKYVDITNPEAMDWYVDQIWGQLVDLGVDGVKIDFCETFPDSGYDYNGTVITYDWYDPSRIEAGTEHHAFPTYFISEFYKRMNERKEATGKDGSFMVLTRGGGIGSQRNPFLWAGDQCRVFNKLDDQLMAVVNSGLSGVPFMTYDMAGYRYGGGGTNYTNSNSKAYESKVFARAVEFTAFTANIQTHGTVRNVYELDQYAQDIYKNYTAIHEDLFFYFNKLSAIACKTGVPVVRHPVLEYQDDQNVYSLKDVFMLGDGLYVAPILTDNTFSRSVYLPEGKWTNLLTGETVTGGKTVTVSANIGQIPIFLNQDCEDYAALKKVFESNEWTSVKNWK